MSRGAQAPARGPELYWAKAKGFGKAGFTVAQLHRRCCGASIGNVRLYVLSLNRQGAVAPIGTCAARGGKVSTRYAVIRPFATAPQRRRRELEHTSRHDRNQRALWRVMRGLSTFMIRELSWLASSPAFEVTVDTAGLYVRRLVKAGLVSVVEAGVRSRRGVQGAMPGSYALKRSANTGPEPLRIIGVRVFDPNTGAFVGCPIDERWRHDGHR